MPKDPSSRLQASASASEPHKRKRLAAKEPRSHFPSSSSYSSSPKKPRLDSSSARSTAIAAGDMYTFPTSRKRTPANVVDLTSSSPSKSPLKVARPAVISTPNKNDAQTIVVQNRRRTKPDTQAFFDKTAQVLDVSLDKVLQNEKLAFPNQYLYCGVENICKQGRAADLYGRLTTRLTNHLINIVRPRLLSNISPDTDAPQALEHILMEWSQWKKQGELIRDVYFYLERTHLLSLSKKLDDATKEIFLEQILTYRLLEGKAMAGICTLIALSRADSSNLNIPLAKAAVKMFTELGLYSTKLEPKILEESQSFFEEQSARRSQHDSLVDYVDWVMNLFQVEASRCDAIELTSFTKRSMTESIDLLAIKYRVERLTSEDFIDTLLDENNVDTLEHVYSLLNKVKKAEELIPQLERWIKERGTDIVFDEKNEDQMVLKLLALKRQVDTIWIASFHRQKEFAQQSRIAFEVFMNKTKKSKANYGTDNTKQGEMIAKYVNMLLEGGSKTIPSSLLKASAQSNTVEVEDNEVHDENKVIEEQLDQVLDLFRFLHGKAVFEAFYKRDLARRLLLGRSANQDAELSMITRLTNECGSNFTQNLETMFKDMELSREEMVEYKSRQAEAGTSSAIDLDVHVLSSAAWPSYPDIAFNVPKEVKNALTKFELNYQSHHSNRKLFWKYGLHHTSLVARFPGGTKELVVSAFQAAVLLMFSSTRIDESISYEEIKAQTQLPEEDLKLTLQSLACATIRPLRKTPQGRDINSSDKFYINTKFSSPRYRVKINRIQQKETKKEAQETHERVQLDREFETQAAIVRIMKSKKEYPHPNLMADVIDATKKRGVLTPPEIKKQIDRLIEKDYLCRLEEDDPSKKGVYGYVA